MTEPVEGTGLFANGEGGGAGREANDGAEEGACEATCVSGEATGLRESTDCAGDSVAAVSGVGRGSVAVAGAGFAALASCGLMMEAGGCASGTVEAVCGGENTVSVEEAGRKDGGLVVAGVAARGAESAVRAAGGMVTDSGPRRGVLGRVAGRSFLPGNAAGCAAGAAGIAVVTGMGVSRFPWRRK